jgi:hypothetical protein
MGNSKKSTTALTVGGSAVSMENVPALIAAIDKQLESLQSSQGGNRTDGNLSTLGININTEIDIENLIKAKVNIRNSEKLYNEELKTMKEDARFNGVSLPEYKVGKWGADVWINDINNRILEVTHEEKINKLKASKDKLTKYISKEQQLLQDMQDIADMFK